MDAARGTRPATPRQLTYLRAIGALAPGPLVAIAAKVDVSVHAAGEMVLRLERAGWVEPTPARRFRRFKMVTLTGAGVLECLEANARAFGEAMRDGGIHVGIGAPPRCVVCDVPYPCAAAAAASSPPCLADADATGH